MASWDGAHVAALVRQGRTDEAAAIIAVTLDAQPHFLPARLTQARLFLSEGKSDKALELSADLFRAHPENIWVAALRFEALLRNGDIAAARDLFLGTVLPAFADRPELAQLTQHIIEAVNDRSERVAFLEAALKAQPRSVVLAGKLAGQYYIGGRRDEASAMIRLVEDQGPLPAFLRPLRFYLAAAGGDHAGAIHQYEMAAKESPDSVEPVRRLIRVQTATGRFEDAASGLASAVDKWPGEWLLLYRYNRTFVPLAIDEQIFARLTEADPDAQTPLWQFQFALAAIRLGRTDTAMRLLGSLSENTPVAPMALSVLTALSNPAVLSGQGRVGRDRSVALEVVRTPGATASIVSFSGVLGGQGYLPNEIADAVVRDVPAHLIYLRDPYGLGYLRGIPALGVDETTSIAALAGLLKELGSTRIVTTGGSIAGYAAVRWGLRLGAAGTVSFAGPTTLSPLHDSGGEGASETLGLGLAELRSVAGGDGDLREAIRSARDYWLNIVIGEGYVPDQRRAERLTSLDNVSITTLLGVDYHFTSMAAIGQGSYARLLTEAVLR